MDVTGRIIYDSESTIIWALRDKQRLFEYSKVWCSQYFRYGGFKWRCCMNLDVKDFSMSFYLELKVEFPAVNVNYKMFIKDRSGHIFWESAVILDTLGADNYIDDEEEGMQLCHKVCFIKEVMDCSCDCLFIHIQFNPPEISSCSADDRQKMLCASILRQRSVEVIHEKKKSTKEEFPNDKCTEEKRPEQEKNTECLRELESLQRALETLLDGGSGSDAVLKVGEKEFPVHRGILMARSPVFDRMFQYDMVENINGVISISDCDPDTVKKFLSYIYSGKMPDVTEDNVIALHGIADMYEFPTLVKHCRSQMKGFLSVNNFCKFFSVFVKYDYPDYISVCKSFFKENIRSIVKTEDWVQFLGENPMLANELFISNLNSLSE